jgi:plastocyanin
VQTFKITPAANATSSPAGRATDTPATSEPTAAETSETTPAAGGTTITIAGVGSQFDVEEVQAAAGPVTIEFDNRDAGVIHNFHVYRGEDSDGESVAETELETGPVTQTVTFDAEPGTYYYVCDVHPTTMEGTLTVE